MPSFGIPDLDASLEADLALGMQGVEELLREHIKGDYPLVEETSRHLVAAGGKRLRPLLHPTLAIALVRKLFRPLLSASSPI
jgi:heptaprenyl diphosphate synthase